MALAIVLLICHVALAVHYHHLASLDNKVSLYTENASVQNLLHCAERCKRKRNCQTFSYQGSQSLCVLQGQITSNILRNDIGWRTWLKEHEAGEISTCAGLSNATAAVIKACEDGDVDRVKLLTSIYSELTKCPGKQQMTPIMAAALAGQGKVWLILAKKRLDLNRVDQYQRSILHLACIGGNVNIVRGVIVRERKKTDRLNLEKKAYHGITPLITAAGNGHRDIVKLLLKRGARISNTDTRKNTALHWASIRGHLNIVKHLINMKSDPDHGSRDGTTPLMYSIQHNREQVFQRLVEKSDLTKVDYAGNNPLHIAAFFGRTKMTSALVQKNIPIASLCYLGRNAAMKAAYSGEIPTLAILIKQNADINLRDINGNTILHIACMKNHPFMVKYLLKRLKITNFLRLKNNDNRAPEELALHYKNDRVFSYIQSFKQSKSTKKP